MTKSARKKIKFKRSGKVNNFKLGAVVLTALITLVLLGKVISAVASLGQPYSPDIPEADKVSWDGKSTLNLVVNADEVYVLSFNPVKKEAVIFKIPENVYVNVPFGFGSWSMGSVYKLGQSENPPLGSKLLKEGVSLALGLPVSGYLITAQKVPEGGFAKVIDDWRSNPFAAFSFLRHNKTDLSFREFWQLVWGLKGVRFDKFQKVDLENSSLSSWSLRADGSRVLSLNQAKLDQFIQKQIEESKIKDEGFSIGIYNATEYPALAEKAGRIISNMGGRVTFIANSPKVLERSIVLGPSSSTATYLSHLFTTPCPKEALSWNQRLFNFPKPQKANSCTIDSDLPTSRAEVNIFLGKDYFQEHVGRQ